MTPLPLSSKKRKHCIFILVFTNKDLKIKVFKNNNFKGYLYISLILLKKNTHITMAFQFGERDKKMT